MKCRQCGTENLDGAKFCRNCGNALKTEDKRSYKFIWIFISIAIIGLIVILYLQTQKTYHYEEASVQPESPTHISETSDEFYKSDKPSTAELNDMWDARMREVTLQYFCHYDSPNSEMRQYCTTEWYSKCVTNNYDADGWSEGTNDFFGISNEMVILQDSKEITNVNVLERTVAISAEYYLFFDEDKNVMGKCVWLVSFNDNIDYPKIKNVSLLSN